MARRQSVDLDKARHMRKWREKGYSYDLIGRRFGVSGKTVQRWLVVLERTEGAKGEGR